MRYALLSAVVAIALSVMASLPGGSVAAQGSGAPGDAETDSLPQLRDCPDCPVMVLLPAGEFVMGSPQRERGRDDDEGPLTLVRLASFAIGLTEITVQEFDAFVAATGHSAEGGCATPSDTGAPASQTDNTWRAPGFDQTVEHPAICVAHSDALAYAAWLSKTTGRRYRLPSEAEWEYAARGQSGFPYYWGGNPNIACRYANVRDLAILPWDALTRPVHNCRDGHGRTAPVARFEANPFGLHDMLGNAAEWVADCATADYRRLRRDGRPRRTEGCELGIVRGGSWFSPPSELRSAAREPLDRSLRLPHTGFRVARDN